MIPLTAVLLVGLNIGGSGRCHMMSYQGQLLELGIMSLALYGATVVFGVPTWMLLRLTKRESGLTCVSMGVVQGLLCAFHLVFSNAGTVSLNQAAGFCLFALTGGLIGWAFWRIARDPAHNLQGESQPV